VPRGDAVWGSGNAGGSVHDLDHDGEDGEDRDDRASHRIAPWVGPEATEVEEAGFAGSVDTETTDLDGYVIEIAVVDACTGDTLLDTLVNPGCAISPGAQWVYGITDAEVADAPPWSQVLPELLAAPTPGARSWPTTRRSMRALSRGTVIATASTWATSPRMAAGPA
jgi:hypothetical protein